MTAEEADDIIGKRNGRRIFCYVGTLFVKLGGLGPALTSPPSCRRKWHWPYTMVAEKYRERHNVNSLYVFAPRNSCISRASHTVRSQTDTLCVERFPVLKLVCPFCTQNKYTISMCRPPLTLGPTLVPSCTSCALLCSVIHSALPSFSCGRARTTNNQKAASRKSSTVFATNNFEQ